MDEESELGVVLGLGDILIAISVACLNVARKVEACMHGSSLYGLNCTWLGWARARLFGCTKHCGGRRGWRTYRGKGGAR